MTNIDIAQTLRSNNVNRVLIVDDVFDAIPRPGDLTLEENEWINFFHDLTDAEQAVLETAFPQYSAHRQDTLPSLPNFIQALWDNRGLIRNEIVDPIFERYIEDSNRDSALLAALNEQLTSYGLTVTTRGREFSQDGLEADLIIIDLFLGAMQTDGDSNLSINGLKSIVQGRLTTPPLVILMSSSPFLLERHISFRDTTELYESSFRFIKKENIVQPNELSILLSNLTLQKSATHLLARFIAAFNTSTTSAVARVSSTIKKLSLTDIAQIQDLLLNAEGEPTGSYLVDVFDRTLQFEVENEEDIIAAAKELNNLNVVDHPPLYLPNDSSNLLSLVYKTLFQNKTRISLSETGGGRVFFGDILRKTNLRERSALLKEISNDDVLIVVTPACDLQRPEEGAKKIMLMVGTLHNFNLTDWRKSSDADIKTPIIILEDGSKKWIKWNPKHIETFSYAQMDKFFSDTPKLEVIARVRESHALEIQQKLLSNMGRVGLIAPLPATVPMRVDLYLPDANRRLIKLDIPMLAQTRCTCYSGRKSDQSMKLVIPEVAGEEITKALLGYDINTVHELSRPILEYLKTSTELSLIRKGIDLPEPLKPNNQNAPGLKPIKSFIGATVGEGEHIKPKEIGYIKFGNSPLTLDIDRSKLNNCGFVLITHYI